jgi:protein tyrosine phosphatase (PTP) superfamily phosphohydrolase (DUF442 family)
VFGQSNQDRGWKGYSTFLVATIAVVGLGYLWWSQQPNFHTVLPTQVYRCAQPSADDLRLYREKYGIKTVVNLRGPWKGKDWYDDEHRVCDQMGVDVVDINLVNHQIPPLAELKRLVQTLDDAPRPILLHCRQGADRTALASAIARLLAGDSVEQAKREYSIAYGHTGLAHGSHLPNLFNLYADWLRKEGQPSGAESFRQWVDQLESLHYFAANIEPAHGMETLKEGSLWELTLRVTNTSQVAWPADTYDMHVNVWIRPKGEKESMKHRVNLPKEKIVPGQTVTVSIAMPPITPAGDYDIEADVCDGKDIKFRVMGPFAWKQTMEVVPVSVARAKTE